MALTLETRSEIWEILRDHFVPTVVDTFYGTSEILSMVERNKKDIHGRQIIIKYKTQGNQGFGNREPRETLPTAGTRKYAEGITPWRSFYAPLDLTGQEVHAIDSKGAFIDLVADAFEDTKTGARADINRQLMGDGSGRIAQVSSFSGSVITIKEGSALWFPVGMECSFYKSDGTHRTGTYSTGTVQSVDVSDLDAMTVTFDHLPTDLANDDYIYREGNYSSTFAKEFMGMKGHFSESNPPYGTYQGKDRSTAAYGYLRAIVHDNSGTLRALSSLLLNKIFAHGKMINRTYATNMMAGNGIRNSYVLLLEANKQPIEELVSKTGFSSELKFIYGGQPMTLTVVDDAPRNTIYIFDPKYLEWREAASLQWENTNGGKLTASETKDKLWGRLFMHGEFICTKPTSLLKLDDIKADTIS